MAYKSSNGWRSLWLVLKAMVGGAARALNGCGGGVRSKGATRAKLITINRFSKFGAIKRGVASTSIFKENRKRTTYHPDPDQTTTVENQTYQSVGRFFIASVMA